MNGVSVVVKDSGAGDTLHPRKDCINVSLGRSNDVGDLLNAHVLAVREGERVGHFLEEESLSR